MIALPGVTIQDTIYESAYSLVYRGMRDDGLAIVIKRLKQEYPSPQALTRYRQEYAITRSLNLEGVIKVYSQQDYQRTLIILLEDFGGESLEHWMRQRANFCPMPIAAFLRLAIDLTDILGKIHAANIIHKDLNPGNIVLNPDTGVVKIIDFGIATQFNRTNPTFKSLHVLEGTLAYLSPEQTGRMNRLLDYRTDFYSLGVTFYQLLTGQLPFLTTDVLELVHCHLAKQPTPPHELNGTIPKTVSDIILKLMAKNAEDRYQSAWGIKADLERCAEQLAASGQVSDIQLGLQDISDQFQIPQKLYGRDAEIAALLAAFERVAGREDAEIERRGDTESHNVPASPCPRVPASAEMLLVSGYSGVGKSALVQELYKPITAKRGCFISGKFDQFQRNIPYSAIVDALRKLVQQLLSEPEDRVQQWRSRLLAALGSNGQLIIDVIPEVEMLVGQQQPVAEVGSTEAQNRFNRVFQQFIRVFCSKEHPLVIFLDDLQWIDSATLKLIELLLLDEQTQFLFLIGAYRDHEVSPTHPLILTLEGLQKQGAVLHKIVLSPLTLELLSKLIAEALHRDIHTVLPLAEFVLRKTGGNPFFVGEFLRSLHSENLLNFDVDQRSWQWDVTQIEAQNITDNVVDLLLSQLKKLPEGIQQVLQLAACIGAEFDLETLAISAERNSEGTACKQSLETISQDLLTAVQAGFIQPLSEPDENLLVQEYKFLHDRVQQAAYALIDESQKQTVHLQIGRNLLEKAFLTQLSERLFEIVDHLNHGLELVTDQAERDEIARLNLMAGQKAKAAIAYSMAQNYLAVGRAWLAASSWQTNYELTLALYTETTEVSYLCADFEQVEYWVGIVLQQAKTVLDTVEVYEVKIQTDIAQNQFLKAINTALQVLQQLGISFPETPSQSDIQLELDAVISCFKQKPIRDLIHLPEMVGPKQLAIMRILSSIMIVARFAAPYLMFLLAAKQVNLLIQYGNTFISAFAYATFGLVLCIRAGDVQAGYEFGQLALTLLSRPHTHLLEARTLYILNYYIIHWKEHLRESLEPLLEGYQSGLETGDLGSAACCAYVYCYNSFRAGKDLVELEREMTTYCEAIRQLKQDAVLIWLRICHQSILNLMGTSVNPYRLINDSCYEENKLPKNQIDEDVIHLVHFDELFLCYLFSEYAQAVENSTLVETDLSREKATLLAPLYHFYGSLARLATYPESSAQTQAEILNKVALSQEKMKYWAHHGPMNYLHKYHLVEAEKARVLDQLLEAEEFYEQAIQGARDNKYLQEEALAYELAAKFYLSRGREKFAQTYMKEAHYCYERWGAMAKVKDLETRYSQLFPQSSNVVSTPVRTTTGTSSNTLHTALDLATVMKAAQAISSEIELERLLSSLMQILIENAGAQTGCLLLENSGVWTIEAACELNEGEQVCATQVLQSVPIANRLPESIIHYVIRTNESVILNNATRDGNFTNDPYIQCNQTQSLFCLPLLNQSKLVGVLYLENQLAAGAFTPDRSQVLNLLSSQAAIAIENARLYLQLRASESRMKQFLEAVPVGISILDAAGRPYYINQRGIQLVGEAGDSTVTADQLAEAYQAYMAGTNQPYPTQKMPIVRALNGERTTVDDMEIYHSNQTIPLEVWGTPVFDEQGNVVYGIAAFQDITERKQAEHFLANYNRTLEEQVAERTAALQESEAALRHREQELRLIADALPALISYVDANRCYQFINRTYEVWFSRSRDEILGNSVHDLLSETVYERVEPYIDQVFEGQTVTLEAELPFLQGKRCISATLIPDFDANAQVRGFYSLITDISDRKRAEHASILEERNRMAREIHDTLAQSFTGILLQVGAATQVLTDDREARQEHLEMLEMIDELARTGLAEARRSVAALRPQLLEDGNLQSALHRLVAQMRASTDIILVYESKGTAYPLPTDVENHLLRIGQEALTNAIKYADASEIRVELVYETARFTLCVQDDGRGFSVGSAPSVGGFGLLGMSERAEQMGAHLSIQSQPRQGTEIIVIVNRA
jgi:PAS domain S-box-containing protein